MGNAFHRKQLPISHARTRGTGIRYIEPTPLVVPELTPEKIAARAERDAQRAALNALHEVRREQVGVLLEASRGILGAWKRGADQADKALAEFPGWWTTESFCPLPVNAEVAMFYANLVREYRDFLRENGFPFEIERLDEGMRGATTPIKSTDEIVAEVLRLVNITTWTSFTEDGFDAQRFLIQLENRADKMQHLGEPLEILCDALEPALVGDSI